MGKKVTQAKGNMKLWRLNVFRNICLHFCILLSIPYVAWSTISISAYNVLVTGWNWGIFKEWKRNVFTFRMAQNVRDDICTSVATSVLPRLYLCKKFVFISHMPYL